MAASSYLVSYVDLAECVRVQRVRSLNLALLTKIIRVSRWSSMAIAMSITLRI
jgi:hypothetical protein